MLPVLETERLRLREVRLEDGAALQAFQNRPEQWRFQAIEPEEMADGTLRVQRYFEHCGPDEERRLFVYVAVYKASNEIVGQGSLSRSHPAIAHLGFGIDSRHFNKGLATELAHALVGFGFEQVGLHRIAADVSVDHAACHRVLEKIGMVREGIARDCIFAQGRWWTEAQYAILEQDYRARAKAA